MVASEQSTLDWKGIQLPLKAMPRFNTRKWETFSVPLDLLSWHLVEAFCLFVFAYFKGEMVLVEGWRRHIPLRHLCITAVRKTGRFTTGAWSIVNKVWGVHTYDTYISISHQLFMSTWYISAQRFKKMLGVGCSSKCFWKVHDVSL